MAYEPNEFGYKDFLQSGDPDKVIKGGDFDVEFNAIKEALDSVDVDVNVGDVNGLEELLDNKADQSDLDNLSAGLQQEISDREAADEDLQNNINSLVTNDLADVSSEGAEKDQFLIHNGTQWVAEDFHVETDLTFIAGISVSSEPAPVAEAGDVYLNNEEGVAGESWTGIAGKFVNIANAVGWSEARSRWYLLGDVFSDVYWEQNGDDIYYDKGDVMVGNKLTAGELLVNGTDSFIKCELDHEGTGTQIWQTTTNFAIYPNGESSKGFTINNATGNVGIGMSPATFDLSAKEQLAEWKTKAKKASWPIVTDNAFDQEPTEDLVAQWIETRVAGDKLQVDGGGSFTGNVAASGGADIASTTNTGITLRGGANVSNVTVQTTEKAGNANNIFQGYKGDVLTSSINAGGAIDITTVNINSGFNASDSLRVKGTTSNSNTCIRPTGTIYRTEVGGLQFTADYIRPVNGTGVADEVFNWSLGNGTYKFKDAYFSGTIHGKVDDVADHIKAITPTQIANWDAGTSGGDGPSANIDSRIKDDDIVHWNKAWDWGDHSAANYQPAGNYEISGTAYTKAQSDNLYMSKNAIANGSRTGDMLSWTNGGWAVDPYISTGSKTVDIGTTEIINLYSPTISHEPFQVNGTMTATTVVKYGGTADQLLCANGSVADKGYSKAETKANVVMTEEQYNALGSKDANTIYFLT